jgi:malonate decarboxylase beta subunit
MTTFSDMRARQRAETLLDPGTFRPLADVTADMPLVAGSGLLFGVPVFVALTDGHTRGGTIGVREASLLANLAESAVDNRRAGRRVAPVLIGFDTGGVRVEEGPRALAAASAIGVALARLTLIGVPLAAVISGPRGCFGAPAVMAALPRCIVMTDTAHWGLTGPRLIGSVAEGPDGEHAGFVATNAATRTANGDAHAMVSDSSEAVRAALRRFAEESRVPAEMPGMQQQLAQCAAITASLRQRLRTASAAVAAPAAAPRRRDLLRYSLRGQWKPSGPLQRAGLIHAAFGTLDGGPALGFILEAEPAYGSGVGIEEAAVVTDMLRTVASRMDGPRAAILTFLFCQGHAVHLAQERFGLPRALGECLRAMVAARRLGHPIISVLGGGTYGAAYLALAAPSHRILALRGTSIAPMAPHVLQAFQALHGFKSGQEAEMQLAELIPGIRMVDSVIRLPRVLREELAEARATVRPEA